MADRETYLGLLAKYELDEQSIMPVLRPSLMKPDATKLAMLSPLQLLETLTALAETADKTANDVLAALAVELRQGFERAGVTPPEGTYHGVFPTGCFNAQVRSDEGGFLVLVESGAFELIEYVATLVAGPWSRDETIELICRACRKYYATLDEISPWLPDAQAELDTARKPTFEQYRTAVGLTSSAEFFLIAHEWAHIILKHIEDKGSNSILAPVGEVTVVAKSQLEEHAADLLALRTIVRGADKSALEIATAGAHVFLGIALLLGAFDQRDGRTVDTHPAATDRIYMMNYMLALEDLERDADLAWTIEELFDDCHVAEFGRSPTRPPVDRDLNRKMRDALGSFPHELGGDSAWSALLDI